MTLNSPSITGQPIGSTESKKDRFKRLAALRTNNVLYRIRVLGNCANRSAYEYSEDDVKKIFGTIEEELKLIESRFKDSKREKFKL